LRELMDLMGHSSTRAEAIAAGMGQVFASARGKGAAKGRSDAMGTKEGRGFMMGRRPPIDTRLDLGFLVGAGEGNRTLMTSLEDRLCNLRVIRRTAACALVAVVLVSDRG
jgi:hypothetical protein